MTTYVFIRDESYIGEREREIMKRNKLFTKPSSRAKSKEEKIEMKRI